MVRELVADLLTDTPGDALTDSLANLAVRRDLVGGGDVLGVLVG
ncbi:hypothetical protein ABH926_004789 [Catenulispora sp. GP43]